MVTIDITSFTADYGTIAGVDIPDDFNGQAGAVDMCRPVDTVGPKGKVILGANNYDMKANILYQLDLTLSGKDWSAAFTDEEYRTAVDVMTNVIARARIYDILHRVDGVTLVYRSNDTAGIVTPANAHLRGFARKAYALIERDPEGPLQQVVAAKAQLILWSIGANAIHRAQNDGHNWYTNRQSLPGSLTARTLAVAGAGRMEFGQYMLAHGHDGNHHLSDATLAQLALVLTDEANPKTITSQVVYKGADVNGEKLTDIINVGQAMKDRYPPSELGKAAMIVAIAYTKAMITHICGRIKVTGFELAIAQLNDIENFIATKTLGRAVITDIETKLADTISTSFGYCSTARLIDGEPPAAYESHAARRPAQVAAGKSLAQVVQRSSPHEQAVASAISNNLAVFAAAFDSIAGTKVGTDKVSTATAPSASDIKAEAGKAASGVPTFDFTY